MIKSKAFLVLAAVAVFALLLCACNNVSPDTNESVQSTNGSEVSATAIDTEKEVSGTKASTSETIAPEVTQGENDLQIITVPQENTTAPDNTEVFSEAETSASSANETEPATTEAEKIELPFVPVS